MQSNAVELESARAIRLAALEAKETEDQQQEEEERLRKKRFGRRAGFEGYTKSDSREREGCSRQIRICVNIGLWGRLQCDL